MKIVRLLISAIACSVGFSAHASDWKMTTLTDPMTDKKEVFAQLISETGNGSLVMSCRYDRRQGDHVGLVFIMMLDPDRKFDLQDGLKGSFPLLIRFGDKAPIESNAAIVDHSGPVTKVTATNTEADSVAVSSGLRAFDNGKIAIRATRGVDVFDMTFNASATQQAIREIGSCSR